MLILSDTLKTMCVFFRIKDTISLLLLSFTSVLMKRRIWDKLRQFEVLQAGAPGGKWDHQTLFSILIGRNFSTSVWTELNWTAFTHWTLWTSKLHFGQKCRRRRPTSGHWNNLEEWNVLWSIINWERKKKRQRQEVNERGNEENVE